MLSFRSRPLTGPERLIARHINMVREYPTGLLSQTMIEPDSVCVDCVCGSLSQTQTHTELAGLWR